MSCRLRVYRESTAQPGESILRLAGAESDAIGFLRLAVVQPIFYSCGVLPSCGQVRQRRTWFPAEGLPLRMTFALENLKLFTELIGKHGDELIAIFALEVGRYQGRIHSERGQRGIDDIQRRVGGLLDVCAPIVLQYLSRRSVLRIELQKLQVRRYVG